MKEHILSLDCQLQIPRKPRDCSSKNLLSPFQFNYHSKTKKKQNKYRFIISMQNLLPRIFFFLLVEIWLGI